MQLSSLHVIVAAASAQYGSICMMYLIRVALVTQ